MNAPRSEPTLEGSTPPPFDSVAVVCAHPDDESFGLGAVITAFVEAGARVDLVCLTCGENSSLSAGADLAARRTEELTCAANILGIHDVSLHQHPDGALTSVPLERLCDDIIAAVHDPQALLTYDRGGITGHPDHQRATDAAIAVGERMGIPVLGWALPEHVAATLRQEFSAPFVGRDDTELDLALDVDRSRQRAAIACHGSQLAGNPVPERRIELHGDQEHLRELYRPR